MNRNTIIAMFGLGLLLAPFALAQKKPSFSLPTLVLKRLGIVTGALKPQVKQAAQLLMPELSQVFALGVQQKKALPQVRKDLLEVLKRHFKSLGGLQQDALLLFVMGQLQAQPQFLQAPPVPNSGEAPPPPPPALEVAQHRAIQQLATQATQVIGEQAKATALAIEPPTVLPEVTGEPGKGQRGGVGQALEDERWRFTVTDVQQPALHSIQNKTDVYDQALQGTAEVEYTGDQASVKSAKGFRLVVVSCQVRNLQKTTEALSWFPTDVHNALVDTDDETHAMLLIDTPSVGSKSKDLLPGSALRFQIVFSVPTRATLKELIFTLRNFGIGERPSTDLRIDLSGK